MKLSLSRIILLGLISFSVNPAFAHHGSMRNQDLELIATAGVVGALGAVAGLICNSYSYVKYINGRRTQENTGMWKIKQENRKLDLQKCEDGMKLVSDIRTDLNNYIEQKSSDASYQLSESLSIKYANELSANQKLKQIVYTIDQTIRENKPLHSLLKFNLMIDSWYPENTLEHIYKQYATEFESIVKEINFDSNPLFNKYDKSAVVVGTALGIMLGAFGYSVVFNY